MSQTTIRFVRLSVAVAAMLTVLVTAAALPNQGETREAVAATAIAIG
jgi:hypothetical protein